MASKNMLSSGQSDNKKHRTNPLTVIALTVIIGLVLLGSAGFWGLRYFGRLDLLSRVPVVGRHFVVGTAAAKSPGEELAEDRAELETEKNALAAARTAVAQEKQDIEALRAELDVREAAISEAEAELAAAQAGLRNEQERIGRLARMAASMEPKDAVPILENLGDSMAAKVIAALSDKSGAAILAAMDPQTAARLLQAMPE